VAEVFVGEVGETLGGGGWGEGAGFDGGEEFEERDFIHGVTSRFFQWGRSMVRFAGAHLKIEIWAPGFEALGD
jgi:hypothetical protein